jgi:hypothetical protein
VNLSRNLWCVYMQFAYSNSVFSRFASQTLALSVLPNIVPDSTSNVSCATSGAYLFLSTGRSVLCTVLSRRNGSPQKVAWTNFLPAISAGGGAFLIRHRYMKFILARSHVVLSFDRRYLLLTRPQAPSTMRQSSCSTIRRIPMSDHRC